MIGPHPDSTLYLGIPAEAVKKPGMFGEVVISIVVKTRAVRTWTAAFPPA